MFIKDRVWAKLQGWKEQLLSQAGREVLLKVVVQAIPTFAMSCFKLPVTLCNDIEQLIRKFWWGHRGNQRNIHWSKWSMLCLPKALGGMGFKELQKFNDAMLAKQVWRLLENKNSMFHRFFKEIFFLMGIFFQQRKAVDPLRGKASSLEERSSKRVPFGELEMARTSASTRIGGCQPPSTLTFNLPPSSMAMMHKCQC